MVGLDRCIINRHDGGRTDQGFTLANTGLEVFERKPKAPSEVASPQAEALFAAPNTATSAVPSSSLSKTTPAQIDPASPAPVSPAADAATPSPANRKSVLSLKHRQATS